MTGCFGLTRWTVVSASSGPSHLSVGLPWAVHRVADEPVSRAKMAVEDFARGAICFVGHPIDASPAVGIGQANDAGQKLRSHAEATSVGPHIHVIDEARGAVAE